MSTNARRNPAWVPDACTLPTAQQPLRLVEFDELFATNVAGSERLTPGHLRLALVGDEQLAATVTDLADRESDCCSFFTFTVTSPRPGSVVLDIEVPAAHVDVLDALANRATEARGRQ
jgi:hypothetical protein